MGLHLKEQFYFCLAYFFSFEPHFFLHLCFSGQVADAWGYIFGDIEILGH